MATTTNYGWTTPDDTSFVKDGASAIRTVGSSVDTTLFTALGGTYPGLRLIKKQTIGTAVSSVAVTNAFSATYENYVILYNGGSGSVEFGALSLQLTGSTTGYYNGLTITSYAGTTSAAGNANGSAFAFCGYASTVGTGMNVNLLSPFLTTRTIISATPAQISTTGGGGVTSGFHNVATSFTGFSIIPASGTITGGTIYVYGYGAS